MEWSDDGKGSRRFHARPLSQIVARVRGNTEIKERAMKDGHCTMCKSNEVYMTEKEINLSSGGVEGLSFSAEVVYRFETVASGTQIPKSSS